MKENNRKTKSYKTKSELEMFLKSDFPYRPSRLSCQEQDQRCIAYEEE